MKRIIILTTILAVSIFIGTAAATHAETILQGLDSTTTTGTTVPGTVDTAYITAVFGTASVFVQDSSGGIYIPYGAIASSGLTGLTVGTQVTGLTGGGFEYYSTYNEFEYYAGKTTSTLTISGSTAGTASSIPSSYFMLSTVAGVLNNQGSSTGTSPATVTPGLQNQLVTLKNVTIETSTGGAVSGNFAAGKYLIVDSSSSSSLTLYINSGDTDVIGTPIPTGPENVSGVFDEYSSTTQEIEPRGLYDFAAGTAVPEPSSYLLSALTLLAGGIGFLRHRRQSWVNRKTAR